MGSAELTVPKRPPSPQWGSVAAGERGGLVTLRGQLGSRKRTGSGSELQKRHGPSPSDAFLPVSLHSLKTPPPFHTARPGKDKYTDMGAYGASHPNYPQHLPAEMLRRLHRAFKGLQG